MDFQRKNGRQIRVLGGRFHTPFLPSSGTPEFDGRYHRNFLASIVKPTADLGDTAPRNQGTGDSRGTMAVMPSKNIQHKLHKKDHKKKDDKGKTMTGHSLTRVDTTPTMTDTQDIKDVVDHVIPNLQFVNENVARESVTRIETSSHSIVHKIQAATNMTERAKVASERSSDPIVKQQLNAAYNVYKTYIDKNK
jgi:hypothetical protein